MMKFNELTYLVRGFGSNALLQRNDEEQQQWPYCWFHLLACFTWRDFAVAPEGSCRIHLVRRNCSTSQGLLTACSAFHRQNDELPGAGIDDAGCGPFASGYHLWGSGWRSGRAFARCSRAGWY